MGNSAFKCVECGAVIVGSPQVFKHKNLCSSCYQAHIKEINSQEADRQIVISYILEKFNLVECPNSVVEAITQLIKDGKKPMAIKYTLWYYFNILGYTVTTDSLNYIRKIIIDNYDAARDYKASVQELKNKNAKIDINVPSQSVQVNINNVRGKRSKITYRMEDL